MKEVQDSGVNHCFTNEGRAGSVKSASVGKLKSTMRGLDYSYKFPSQVRILNLMDCPRTMTCHRCSRDKQMHVGNFISHFMSFLKTVLLVLLRDFQ